MPKNIGEMLAKRKSTDKKALIPAPLAPSPVEKAPPWPNPHLMLLWTILTIFGAFLLATNILAMSLFALDIAYLGLILFSIGIIGLNDGLSRTFALPQYNLWEKIKHFANNHLFLCSCFGLGILMVNPWITALGVGIGLWIEQTEPNLLIEGNKRRIALFKKIEHFFSGDQQPLLDFSKIRNLSFTCLVIGACLAFVVYVFLLPWVFTPALILSNVLIDFSLEACGFIMQCLIGGYLPGLSLVGIAAFISAGMCTAPLVLFVASGCWLGFKCGEILHQFYTFMSKKTYEKGLEVNHYLNIKHSQLKALLSTSFVPAIIVDLPANPLINSRQYQTTISTTKENISKTNSTTINSDTINSQPSIFSSKPPA